LLSRHWRASRPAAPDTLKISVPQRGSWDTGISELGQRGGIFKRHGLTLDGEKTGFSGVDNNWRSILYRRCLRATFSLEIAGSLGLRAALVRRVVRPPSRSTESRT
jgi:hypothetical protein